MRAVIFISEVVDELSVGCQETEWERVIKAMILSGQKGTNCIHVVAT